MNEGFERLRVIDTRPETAEATSVIFEVPAALRELFAWQAGQHLTLRFVLDGAEVRRSYSISDTPEGGRPLRITVKRVRGGLVSNHIVDQLRPGDEVDVMPPFGGFRLAPKAEKRRTCYFFGAGSGITPLYAMIGSLLASEPHSVARLAYGNTDDRSIILGDDLARLERESAGRLSVRHVLSSPSWLSSFRYWRRGRIDAECVAAFIDAHPPYAQDAHYYVCGPGGMNSAVRSALLGLDVPPDRIHVEHYGAPAPPDDSVAGVAAEALVRLRGETLTVPVSAGQTVLDAVRAAAARPPYSCESGVCGACRARLRDGDVHLRASMALHEAELAEGVILTCQALPTSPRLALEYD